MFWKTTVRALFSRNYAEAGPRVALQALFVYLWEPIHCNWFASLKFPEPQQLTKMGFSHRDFLAIIYSFSIFLLVAITVYAFVIGYLFRRKNSTAEGFITARGQVSCLHTCGGIGASSL